MGTRDYEADMYRAIRWCPVCQPLSDSERQDHKWEALEEVYRTQTRQLEPLPKWVWPEGRDLLP